MPDLTPEERQKIYLEEKARMEVRRELEGQKTGIGKIGCYIVLVVIGILVVLYTVGSSMEQSREAKFNSLTPEQRHAETLRNCASLLKSWEFKTYSELSVTERQMQAACIDQVNHPDQDIIKPSH